MMWNTLWLACLNAGRIKGAGLLAAVRLSGRAQMITGPGFNHDLKTRHIPNTVSLFFICIIVFKKTAVL